MCEPDTKNVGDDWIYFLRQLLICTGTWSCLFMLGLCVGSSTVMIPQLRKEANSTEAVSTEMVSWLPSVFSYSGIPWVFILPFLVEVLGRKITHSIVCISSFIGFVIFYCSTDVYQILISEVFQGAITASFLTISVIIITEYTSSIYRGVFLTLKGATFYWGILASNMIGTFFNWRNIALLGLICSVYSIVTVFFWPESPFWLAKKGRLDKCRKAHRWLKGAKLDSENELEKLITDIQKRNRKKTFKTQLIENFKVLATKEFYRPVILSALLTVLYTFSGKLVCTVYAIDIIKKITQSESTAYAAMLILDGITVSTMYIGCALAKAFKRRSLLLISSTIAVMFMFLLSLYLYLIKLKIISIDKYLPILFLVGYSVSISCGPMILSISISGELISLNFRSLSMCVIALVFKLINGSVLRLSPYCFNLFGMHGTFLLFGLSSSVCLVLIYYYLPETKDKTLQEISACIKGVKPVEEAKELLPIVSNNVTIVTGSNRNVNA